MLSVSLVNLRVIVICIYYRSYIIQTTQLLYQYPTKSNQIGQFIEDEEILNHLAIDIDAFFLSYFISFIAVL